MKLFKKQYLKNNITQPSKDQIDFLKMAYYGGRTETFIRGKVKNLFYYDFNSLYPAQYLKVYPNPNSRKYIKKSNNHYLDYEGVSKCRIITPKKLLIPFLPYRNEKNKLIFPIGKWVGYYTHLELRKAIKLGYKVKLLESIIYTKTFKPFEKFGTDLYKLRMKFKKEKNIFELPIKILLNSLYGKFAQHYIVTEIDFLNKYTLKELNEMIKDEKVNITFVDKYIYIERLDNEIPSFVMPIFSIYITAYARLQMYEGFEKVGLKNVYYCDTDSIITDVKMNCSNKLGDLKQEHKIKKGVLVKPKIYGFITPEKESIIRCKGIPRNVIGDFKQFKKFLLNPIADFTKFIKFKESIKSKSEYKHGKLRINQKVNFTKILTLNDDKRNWKRSFNMNTIEYSSPICIL